VIFLQRRISLWRRSALGGNPITEKVFELTGVLCDLAPLREEKSVIRFPTRRQAVKDLVIFVF
jgi:hypothetical protein